MQFFNKLSIREKSIIVGGGVVLVLFLLYFFVVAGMVARKSQIETKVEREREKETLLSQYVTEYESLRVERDQLRNKIKERDENFSLAREISEIQSQLSFPSQTAKPGKPSTKFDSYIQSKTSINYKGKTLDQIVNFLYALEKPERGIIVENFRLQPSKDRKQFTFSINLYSVSLVDSKK
jgi:cell division protein FtsB